MNNVPRTATVGLGALLGAAATMLVMASVALAVQTDQYDRFSACPTGAPILNEPASEFAICGSGTAHNGLLKIGTQAISLSQVNLQFGAIGLGLDEPECPPPGLCFGRAPGTTTLDSSPSVIEVGSAGNGSRGKGIGGKHAKGKGVRVKLTVELAGDVRAVSTGFLTGLPVPLYRLPIKLHVEAPWLGPDCYVGSNDEPIFLMPFLAGPPAASPEFLADPNGFQTEAVALAGVPLADKAIAIPAADGCGHSRSWRHGADRFVDSLLGLPSPSGANEVLLPDTELAFAGAGFDGTPPDGGAELQAAFDAAK